MRYLLRVLIAIILILLLAQNAVGLYMLTPSSNNIISTQDHQDYNCAPATTDEKQDDNEDDNNMQTPQLSTSENSRSRTLPKIGTISKTLEIKPGEKYYAYLDYENDDIVELDIPDPSENLPQAVKDALAAVPSWLHDDLEYTFTTLTTSEATTYANYILNAEDPDYIDEIAFCIAHSHQGLLSWMISNGHDGIFAENAEVIYTVNSRGLNYAQLVEKTDYTTISYNSYYGGTQELDRDTYYWYVVYPRTHLELPMYFTVDSTPEFWRTFFLDDVRYGQSLYNVVQGSTTMYNAVQNLGNWLIGFMEFQYGWNGIQPIDIYLNPTLCSCGQYTIITGAMAKTALIPVYSPGTHSEDHIWNEFYDTKWLHWDTSLGDIDANELNLIDGPGTYDPDPPDDYGPSSGALGREVSAVYLLRGDEAIFQCLQYTPYGTLTISVTNKNDEPVDGAKIFVYPAVSGSNNPNRGVCIWGYTDSFGKVAFEVGNNLDYFAKSIHPVLGELPGGNQVGLVAQNVQNGQSYSSTIKYSTGDVLDLQASEQLSSSSGTVKITSSFVVEQERQWCENEETKPYDLGILYPYDTEGQSISVFICDSENFNKYEAGNNFEAYDLNKGVNEGDINFETDEQKDWYVVISNDLSYVTTKTVNFTIDFYFSGRPDVEITSPNNGSTVAIDEIVTISGTVYSLKSVSNVEISINDGDWSAVADTSGGTWSTWKYDWDTAGSIPDLYKLEVRAIDLESKIGTATIFLILEDVTPPSIIILEPADNSQFDLGSLIIISGTASDNVAIKIIEIILDGNNENSTNITASYIVGDWSYEFDTEGLKDGVHSIAIQASDTSSNNAISTINVTLLEIIDPVATITSPLNNSIFELDDSIYITGTAIDNKAVTKLELIIDNNQPIDITLYLNPDGYWTYVWDTGTISIDEGVHSIEAQAFDAAQNLGSVKIYFSLDGTAPEVSIIHPLEDEIFNAGDNILIEGTASDNLDIVTLEIFFDKDKPINITKNLIDDEWEYDEWDTKTLKSGEHKIEVRVTDLIGFESETIVMVVIDAENPIVEISDITDAILIGETFKLKGSASDDIEVIKLELIIDDNAPINITSEYIDDSWSYLLDTSEMVEGDLKISVRVTDIVGKQGTDELTLKIISETTDTDEDGMPDWWELKFGLNPNKNDADRDKDMDGFTNLEEYLGDDGKPGNDDYSDPTDKNSVPHIKETTPLSMEGDLTLVWIILFVVVVIIFILIFAFMLLKRKKRGEEVPEPILPGPTIEGLEPLPPTPIPPPQMMFPPPGIMPPQAPFPSAQQSPKMDYTTPPSEEGYSTETPTPLQMTSTEYGAWPPMIAGQEQLPQTIEQPVPREQPQPIQPKIKMVPQPRLKAPPPAGLSLLPAGRTAGTGEELEKEEEMIVSEDSLKLFTATMAQSALDKTETAKSQGEDVSKSEKLLAEARKSLDNGDYDKAMEYAGKSNDVVERRRGSEDDDEE